MTYCELIFVYCPRQKSKFVLVSVVVPVPLVEETGFSLLNYIGSFVKKQMIVNLQVYFWAFYSAPLVCLSVSDTVLITVALFYVVSGVVSIL